MVDGAASSRRPRARHPSLLLPASRAVAPGLPGRGGPRSALRLHDLRGSVSAPPAPRATSRARQSSGAGPTTSCATSSACPAQFRPRRTLARHGSLVQDAKLARRAGRSLAFALKHVHAGAPVLGLVEEELGFAAKHARRPGHWPSSDRRELQRAFARSRNDGFSLGPKPATISSKPGINPVLRWCSERTLLTTRCQSATSPAFS